MSEKIIIKRLHGMQTYRPEDGQILSRDAPYSAHVVIAMSPDGHGEGSFTPNGTDKPVQVTIRPASSIEAALRAIKLMEALEATLSLAERIAAANEFGGLHIVAADGNTDEESVQWCLDQTETPLTDEERELANDMLFWGDGISGFAYWLDENGLIEPMRELLGSAP